MSARCLALFACEALFPTAAIAADDGKVLPVPTSKRPLGCCVRASSQGEDRPAKRLTKRDAVKEIL
ncbi:MAG: hypothetical protein BWX73_01314 [Lentisphaerae bacterium ADurb.Bin082]|nr:MAG: hypothetical protein BWX73_01314 [Lentisphaerae bacterium ADurb.Bin082]